MIAKYFKSSLWFTFFSLILVTAVGYYYSGTWEGAGKALFISIILAILEISLSFDNAIVNASVLQKMTEVWKHRFLTWGILIAVFGMRLILPILIVCVMAGISPWAALSMALMSPDKYAEMMLTVHPMVAAFGGTFLLMVALKYFLDENKDSHWLSVIENPLVKLGKLEAIETVFALLVLIAITKALPIEMQQGFLFSGIGGLITFLIVDAIGAYLESGETETHNSLSAGLTSEQLQKASAGMFLYLEVLDASFSFDGVVGAFAISNNLLIIMLGLGIGAFFVRSLTILFVDKKTLSHFAYLEHGAFYAIVILALIMLLDPFLHIPEWFTGLSGACIIGLSLWSSIREAKQG